MNVIKEAAQILQINQSEAEIIDGLFLEVRNCLVFADRPKIVEI